MSPLCVQNQNLELNRPLLHINSTLIMKVIQRFSIYSMQLNDCICGVNYLVLLVQIGFQCEHNLKGTRRF